MGRTSFEQQQNPTMQNLITLILYAGLIGILPQTVQAQLKIFTCEPEWHALVSELAADRVEIYNATHGRQNPHYIQARPSLIARLRSADLVICTGAELETGWLPMLQRRARNPKVLPGEPGFFEASKQVSLLERPVSLDRAEGDIHAQGNPHIQLDPRRLLKVAEKLSERLQVLDQAGSSYYQERLVDFSKRWRSAIEAWQKRAIPLKGATVIVHHQEWIYLLDWLGMSRIGSLEPKPGVPPNIEHLAKLRQLPAKMVIASPLNDKKPGEWLDQQASIPTVILPQTVGALPNTDDLFMFFNTIIDRLTAVKQM
jgi:zinc/manganese transport system substrate-binding protein